MTEKTKTFEDITGINAEEVNISDSDNQQKKHPSRGVIVDEFDQINSMPSVSKKITDKVSVVEHDLSAVKPPGENEKFDFTEDSSGGRGDNLTIKISGSAGRKILEDFNVSDIGNIDLKEAEKIAGEDMLFLTESDLIEGLEDFELIPLVEADETDSKPAAEIKENFPPEKHKEETHDQAVVQIEENEKIETVEKGSLPVPGQKDTLDNIEVSILEEHISETPQEVPLEEQPAAAEENDSREEPSRDVFDMPLIVDDNREKPAGVSEGEDTPAAEYSDSIIFTDDDLVGKGVQAVVGGTEEKDSAGEDENVRDLLKTEKSGSILSASTAADDSAEEAIPVELSSLHEPDSSESYSPEDDFLIDEPYEKFEKEILPDELQALEVIEDNVLFIDDIIIDKPDIEEGVIFSEDSIEKLSSGYLDLSQVEGKILQEADAAAVPDGRIIETSRFKEFDELAIDFEDDEYKYRDDELDFVENAIFEEDYTRYIYEIDELYHIQGHKNISSAREILGLDSEDLDLIDEKLYGEEYINVNLDEIFNLIREETYAGALKGERFCNYFLPAGDTFLSNEKASIEEDISARGALIFEEDIHKIKAKLGDAVASEDKKNVSVTEEVFDITEKIVIIEDDLDVDRFVKELPDEKQDDMKHLLKYLDGLFEKLPEEVIKKFAHSEYFDVYSKVLNQMGI